MSLTWSKFNSHRHSSVAQGELAEIFGDWILLWLLATCNVVAGNFLKRLQHESSDPHANIRGHDVHQAKARQNLESVNVQLEKPKTFSIKNSKPTSGFVLTREFMKMKYICMKVKIICSNGFTPRKIS